MRLEQIYSPSIQLERALAARVALRARPVGRVGRGAARAETVKELGTFDGVSRDLRDAPFAFELDLQGVPDGTYQLAVEVLDNSRPLGTTTLLVALRQGLDATVARLEVEARRAPAAVRADILYPVDRMRNVNRGRLQLRTFDPERDFAAATAVLTAASSGRDLFEDRTGDFKRHYLLESAGTRAGDCEQSGNGALALGTPIAEHDLPPLHGRPEGSFGHVVGGCDRLFMHEGEEVGVMHEQRAREVRHLDVRGIDVAFCQREQTLLDRQHLRDQLRAREWGTARAGIATEAMPQPKQLPLQRQGLATEAPGCRRCRQVLRTQEIAPEMRPTELAMGGGIRQVRRQSVAAQDAGKGRAQQVPQDVGSTRGGDGIAPCANNL